MLVEAQEDIEIYTERNAYHFGGCGKGLLVRGRSKRRRRKKDDDDDESEEERK